MAILTEPQTEVLKSAPAEAGRDDSQLGTNGFQPEWSHLIDQASDQWVWSGQRLFHLDRLELSLPGEGSSSLQRWIVNRFYSAHKTSKQVNRCVGRLLDELPEDGWGLNLGCGHTRLHPRVINLDVQESDTVDVLTWGTKLPFADNSLDLVISQEVLEHIEDPWETVSEVQRILRPGGIFYCQVPFMIGFHPGPSDYWRFTRQGLEQMFTSENWQIAELQTSLGHGSGFYRVLVEFLAVTASSISQRLYKPAKGLAAVGCYPITWLDVLTHRTSEQDRIPGGYYCVAVKQ